MEIGTYIEIFSKDYSRWGDEKYLKLKEHGYSCIDFNMADTNTPLYTKSLQEADNILLCEKAAVEKAGMKISQVHGPWRWPCSDCTENDRAERMEKMKRSIRATKILGCKHFVIHPIMPFGIDDINTDFAEKTWDMNMSFMGELLKTAKMHDVIICLENMPMLNFSLARAKDILRFVKAINDDRFKICLDTGHVNVFDDLNVGDAVRELRNEIRVLHVHDNIDSKDLHMFPSFGGIDWRDFAKSLKEINFDGCFSLETKPSSSFDDETYETFSVALVKLAKWIFSLGED